MDDLPKRRSSRKVGNSSPPNDRLAAPSGSNDLAVDFRVSMFNDRDQAEIRGGESRRVFEEICESVRAQIARGTLKPGDRLPAERELAERYNVGRNAVREALRTLEIAGVVQLRKGRNGGPYIRPASPNLVTHAIRDLIGYGSLQWQDLTETRSLLLGSVMKVVSDRATAADYDTIERNVDLTEEALREGRAEEYSAHAYEFYTLLARSAHNSVLTLLVTSMSDLVRRFVNTNFDRTIRTPLATLVPVRRRMVKFMRDGDYEQAAAELQIQLNQIHVRINGWIAQRNATTETVHSTNRSAEQLAALEAENARLLAEIKSLKMKGSARASKRKSDLRGRFKR